MKVGYVEEFFRNFIEKMADSWRVQNIESYEQNKEDWLKQINVLDEIVRLYSYEKEKLDLSKEVEESNKISKEKTVETKDKETQLDEEAFEGPYEFQRYLKGGVVLDLNGYVPEGIIRRLDLNSGDLLYAKKVDSKGDSKPHYIYHVAERTNKPDNSGRVQYNLCPVEETGGRLVVRTSNQSGLIKAKGELMPLILSEYDAEENDLVAGDIIDVAFFENNPNSIKVIWKHTIEKMEEKSEVLKSLNNTIKEESTENKEVVDPLLSEMNIVVIGDEHKNSYYKKEIEKFGGTLLMVDGKRKESLMKLHSKRIDVVVCIVSKSSHEAMYASKDVAKKRGIPFIPCPTESSQSVVKLILQKI